MNECYIVLPSNSKGFDDNTTSSFSVRLPYQLTLMGKWELALTELVYPHTWKTLRGDKHEEDNIIWMKWGPNSQYTYAIVPAGHYADIFDLLKGLRQALKDAEKRAVKFHWNLNKAERIKKNLTKSRYYEEFGDGPKCMVDCVRFDYDTIRKRIKVKLGHPKSKDSTPQPPHVTSLLLGRKLQYMLGFDDAEGVREFGKGTTEASYPPDMKAGLSSLFVYTDIIKSQIVGPSLSPLLKCVPVMGKYGDLVEKNYENPQYLEIVSKTIDTISISVRDDQDKPILFEYGKLMLKIHIRKKRLQL